MHEKECGESNMNSYQSDFVLISCNYPLSHLLSTSNVLITSLNVTYTMSVVLVTHLTTYTSKLRNTKTQVHLLASTFVLNILRHLTILVIILAFERSVKANLTAWCLKCFLSMNSDLVSMCTDQNHFLQKFLNSSFS